MTARRRKKKLKPTGYIAICRCGVVIGAMDCNRTDRREAGKLLGLWLSDGYTVVPQFSGLWSVQLQVCRCS